MSLGPSNTWSSVGTGYGLYQEGDQAGVYATGDAASTWGTAGAATNTGTTPAQAPSGSDWWSALTAGLLNPNGLPPPSGKSPFGIDLSSIEYAALAVAGLIVLVLVLK